MTVATTRSFEIFLGDGVNTTFPVTGFELNSSSEVEVYVRDVNAVETLLRADEYSIPSFSNPSTTNIEYPVTGAVLQAGEALIVLRATNLLQEVNVSNQTNYNANVVSGVWDKIHRILQDQFREQSRGVKTPVGTEGYALPVPETGKVLLGTSEGWDNGPDGGEIASAQQYAEEALAAEQHTAALVREISAQFFGLAATPALHNFEGALKDYHFGTKPARSMLMNTSGLRGIPRWGGVPEAQDMLEIVPHFVALDGFMSAELGLRQRSAFVGGVLLVRDESAGTVLQNNGEKWAIRGPAFFENRAQVVSFAQGILANGGNASLGDKLVWGAHLIEFDDTSDTLPSLSGWKPLGGVVDVELWKENTDPGTTDMTDAIKGALQYLAFQTAPVNGSYNEEGAALSPPRTLSLGYKDVLISSPIVLGDLDVNQDGDYDGVGLGCFSHVTIDNGRVVLSDTFDASPLATFDPGTGAVETVPGYAIVLADYRSTDNDGSKTLLNRMVIGTNLHIDCNFKTGAIYLENTQACEIQSQHLYNVGKNCWGILTSPGNSHVTEPNHIGNYNPRGLDTKNGALHIKVEVISGNNRQNGTGDWPAGENLASMNAGLAKIMTADCIVEGFIGTSAAQGLIFDMNSNWQFIGGHIWSVQVVVGPHSFGGQIDAQYMDTTDLIIYSNDQGSMDHRLGGMSFRAGDPNLRLIALEPGTTGNGLVLSGAQFNGTSTITFESEGAGSWADETQREISIAGVASEAEDIPWLTASKYFRVESNGNLFSRSTQVLFQQSAADETNILASRGLSLMADYDANSAGGARNLRMGVRGTYYYGMDDNGYSVFGSNIGEAVGELPWVRVQQIGGYVAFTPGNGAGGYEFTKQFYFSNSGWCFEDDLKVEGDLTLQPSATVTPVNDGDLMFEATSDTVVTIKLKGSDGVIRSAILNLS